ncbi:MAG: hypothetical protein RLZZ226_803 [Pseudomonadota bacterium]
MSHPAVFCGEGGVPEKHWVGRSFGRAADGYDGLAGLQRTTADAVLAGWFARTTRHRPDWILDVGAGTGYPTRHLHQHWPEARVLAVDLAEGMLRVARRHWPDADPLHCVVGDAETLPVADGGVDMLFTNLALQWCSSVTAAFSEFYRVLKPGGQLAFSTFGPATLHELRTAWASVDDHTHVSHFPEPDTLRTALDGCGWAGVELHSTLTRLQYAGVLDLMHELKGLGAHNLTRNRARHLQGKSAWQRMVAAYPADRNGEVWASFEVITGYCRKPVSGK